VNLLEARLEEPLRLKRPRRIAVNLMGDLFHDQVPIEFIGRVFGIMSLAPRHTFMVLTKRPERMVECIRSIWAFAGILRNVWLGTTAGTQRSANERWSAMAWLAQAGWKTWVSSEPRLEAIDWHGWEFLKALATGGESGPYARPMSPAWLRADREWCGAHGVKFWFKQWGEWAPVPSPYPPALSPSGRAPDGEREPGGLENYPMTTLGGEMLFRFGRKMAGRELDGRTWEEWPDFTTKDMKEHEGEL
jgi:protein gp37